jgi:hypothetical protein
MEVRPASSWVSGPDDSGELISPFCYDLRDVSLRDLAYDAPQVSGPSFNSSI